MATAADRFHRVLGDPDPETVDGLPPGTADSFWDLLKGTTKAGWFADRFLYLFGPGLDRLALCLDAWPFIVPPRPPKRTILGYNAYGCILVLEDTDGLLNVKVLNPLTVKYMGDSNLNFLSLLGGWLPDKRIPNFHDTSVFDQWKRENHPLQLDEHEILGIGVPLGSLGGQMELANFAQQDIVEYYQQTAPAYAEAFASMKK